jgi:hypothetical protein
MARPTIRPLAGRRGTLPEFELGPTDRSALTVADRSLNLNQAVQRALEAEGDGVATVSVSIRAKGAGRREADRKD